MPLPSAIPGRTVNCYVLEGDVPAVVDPGPGSDEALERLHAELQQRVVSAPRMLICTHGHKSHAGAVGTLVRTFRGTRVACHPILARALIEPAGANRAARRHLRRVGGAAGVPAVVLDAAAAEAAFSEVPVPEALVSPLDDGARLAVGAGTWACDHAPGHAPDHVTLLHPASGTMLAGDLLVRREATRLALEQLPSRTRGAQRLDGLLGSLRRVSRTAVDTVLPGHGPAILAHRVLVARRLAALRTSLHETRAAVSAGGSTVWDVLLAESPQPPLPAALPVVLGDAIGRLEWLADRGVLVRRVAGGVAVYKPKGSRP